MVPPHTQAATGTAASGRWPAARWRARQTLAATTGGADTQLYEWTSWLAPPMDCANPVHTCRGWLLRSLAAAPAHLPHCSAAELHAEVSDKLHLVPPAGRCSRARTWATCCTPATRRWGTTWATQTWWTRSWKRRCTRWADGVHETAWECVDSYGAGWTRSLKNGAQAGQMGWECLLGAVCACCG